MAPFRRIGRPGLLGTVARPAVIAGTAQTTESATGRSAIGDLLAQLAQLGDLRDRRLLDDAEFAAAKAKLLG